MLAGLSKLANGDADIRHARRDFSAEELERLLESARTSPHSVRKLKGIDRYFLYLTACATGYRANELANMTPESFDLAGDSPTVRGEAGCTKNRREAIQPLPLEVAKALRGYIEGKPAGKPVWPGKWKSRAFLMVKFDHAVRELWLSGFQVARQRDEKAYDLSAAVQHLPIPTAPTSEAQPLRATGTEGSRSKRGRENRSHPLARAGRFREMSRDGTRRREIRVSYTCHKKNPGKHRVSACFPGSKDGR